MAEPGRGPRSAADDERVGAAPGPATERPGGTWRRWLVVAAIGVLALVALLVPLLRSLGGIERVASDPDAVRERLAASAPVEGGPGTDASPVPTGDASPSPPTPGPSATAAPEELLRDEYQSFLVLGSDEREGLAGSRADVILVGLLPADGSAPILFSLPRDLWLPDPCRGGNQRINAAYNGCPGLANGFELTSVVVEDFTGIAIDQVVGIDFEGFTEVIDAVGGVRICVDHPVRGRRRLSLPAGCTLADGEMALAWVRSRSTEEFVDGQWRTMPGVNDLTRNERQQDIMLQLLNRVASFGTVRNLYAFAEGVERSVTVGSGLSLLDGARLAWDVRDQAQDVRRFSIPVTGMTTSGGAQVLVADEPFATTFEREIGVPLGEVVESPS